jgi:hypothetical protein
VRTKNIKLILNYVVGPLVFIVLLISIADQMQSQKDFSDSLNVIVESLTTKVDLRLVAVILLMFVNWGIEARKWQLAMQPLQKLSFIRSFKAVLCGTTLAFFTPNRTGEYVGRMVYVDEGKRLDSIPVSIVASIAQLMITLIAGIGGLLFMRQGLTSDEALWTSMIGYLVIVGVMLLMIFYTRLSWLAAIAQKWQLTARLAAHLKVLENFNATLLLRLLSLSFTRYIVFIVQYYLLFQLFAVELNWWQTFWSMSVMFLVLAVLPTIAVLTDLSIRWKASLELLDVYSRNNTGILATSLAIWVINLIIPALIGSLLILGMKLFGEYPVEQKLKTVTRKQNEIL